MVNWRTTSLALLLGCSLTRSVAADTCPGDLDGDGQVTVDEILVVVNTSLFGCGGAPTPTEIVAASVTPTPSITPTATRSGTASRTPTATRSATPTARFVDNGDGTITDTTTNLMWEKKSDDGSAHDKDFVFGWSLDGSTGPNGTLFNPFLATINAQRFAGHRDWRIPTRAELETIIDRNAPVGAPTVPEAFFDDCTPGCDLEQCSCTVALNYWTATVNPADNQQAGYVLFNNGQLGFAFKTLQFYARAVRGG